MANGSTPLPPEVDQSQGTSDPLVGEHKKPSSQSSPGANHHARKSEPERWVLVGSSGQIALPESGELILGRMSKNAAGTVDCGQVSKQHAKVHVSEQGVIVEDLSSLNGTWVNRKRISERTNLRVGDELCMGTRSFKLVMRSMSEAWIGQTISGRYKLETLLGEGGMGCVYRARHVLIERAVAIKMIRPELLAETHLRAWMLREARAANRVKHERIAEIYDIGETDEGVLYLVMELIGGPRLSQVLSTGRLSLPRAIELIQQIAQAIAAANDCGVIHRDLKPDNVQFITNTLDSAIKVIDFGLSGLAGEPRLEPSSAVFGTPEYMSPEMASGKGSSRISDLYSLGVLFFELITGRLPFIGNTQAEILQLQQSAEPPRPRDLDPSIPPAIEEIVLRLLRKDPAERYQSAHDVLRDIEVAQLPQATAVAVMQQNWHFFIVHASADSVVAERLYDVLSPSFRVFLDSKSLLPGDRWAQRLAEEQRSSYVTLVLISEHCEAAYFAQDEIVGAISLARDTQGRHRVVPILLGDVAIPYGLRGLHSIRTSRGLERLHGELGRLFPNLNSRYSPCPKQLVDELEMLTVGRERGGEGESQALQAERQIRIDSLCSQLRKVPSAREGDTVVGAKLVRAVGKGNFGTVWQAIDLATRDPRAVKIFDAERLGLGLTLYHFRRGVRAMAHLQKVACRPTSICRFYDADSARLAYVMEYVGGRDLCNIRARGWSLTKKLSVFLTLAEAVQVAHENGVLHRDIKPANVVMTEHSLPVLTDFDISDLLFATQQSAQVSGTVCFAAPEQFAGEEAHEPTVDVYSLGRLLHYFLLEKNPPILFERTPSLRDLANAPSQLVDVIAKATAYTPNSRYSTVSLLIRSFREACSQLEDSPTFEDAQAIGRTLCQE